MRGVKKQPQSPSKCHLEQPFGLSESHADGALGSDRLRKAGFQTVSNGMPENELRGPAADPGPHPTPGPRNLNENPAWRAFGNQESIQIVKNNHALHVFTESQPNETEPSQGKSNRIEPQRLDSNQIDQH